MIPITLSLAGFLSYRDPVELDFRSIELACIAGPNGAGKSSLLDAITWALFGQARKRDESLINSQSESAEVSLTFSYEGNLYRVQRSNPRGKSTMVEFHLQTANGDWKPLTERTLRETDARIQETLRMDYETFVNASFFLQGKADQFTQQRPGDRKRILSSILGLEVWETYRQQAGERRRAYESEIDNLDGRMQEIQVELAEEADRVANLERLDRELEHLSQARAAQEASLEALRKVAATLDEQRRLVETLARQAEAAAETLRESEERHAQRQTERDTHIEILARAEEIEASYAAWTDARADLARWQEMADRFREHEKRREAPLREIDAAQARLETELKNLQSSHTALQTEASESDQMVPALASARVALEESEKRLARRRELDIALQAALQRQAEARTENPRLRNEMHELKERIEQLEETEGASCPLCGQPLTPEDRLALIERLKAEGKELGDRYRENKSLLDESTDQVKGLETELAGLADAEAKSRVAAREVDQLAARLESIEMRQRAWEQDGAARLEAVQRDLEDETFAPEARARLAEIDAELKAIGYDAAAHDAVRRAESEGRKSEAALRGLENARAALAPLEREIAELESQIAALRERVAQQENDHRSAAGELEQAEAQAPDLESAEGVLFKLQAEENQLRMELGAARQKVLVLDDLKARRKELSDARVAVAERVGQYRQLERAFGKDGVPALLIEQALPQIEAKANEILERLSSGVMSVRFVTQAEYKDRRRSDLRETLDIQISDSAGIRDYEMFSGGEAFRVNFAIRLALSEILAQRAGARLQTLVIDEGFGSQDAHGRQLLIEAINLVRPEFAKILVITHIEELKDAFPTRIEVEKTPRGSQISVS